MSEVILKLAEPLLKQFGDNNNRIKTIISLTIFEWNRLMLPEDERGKFQDEMFDTLLPPGDEADTVGSILYINELIEIKTIDYCRSKRRGNYEKTNFIATLIKFRIKYSSDRK